MIPLGVLASRRPVASGGSLTFLGGVNEPTTNTGAVRTIPDAPLGDPAANRVIVIAVGLRVASGSSVTGVTIGGVAATIDAITTTWPSALIARAVVPSGMTGDVVITHSGTEHGPRIVAVYSAYGTVTLSGMNRHYSASNTTSTVSLTHAAGASLVAAVSSSSNVNNAFAWNSPFTSDYAVDRYSNGSGGTAATAAAMTHANGLGAGPTTVTAVSNAALYQGMAAAAYVIT